MSSRGVIDLREDDPRAPHVAALLALHMAGVSDGIPADNTHVLDAAALAIPSITFWTAWRGGELAGFAALKDLGDGHGEVKSMRTAPSHLRCGVAHAVLTCIVETARARDYHRLSLETGTSPTFAAANALYDAAGFIDCDAFGGYPPSEHNRFMTLVL